MTTGNASATSNSTYTRPVLEDGLAKLLSSIDCQNVFTQDIPPVTGDEQFANLLQVHSNSFQPVYEGWFANRATVTSDASASNNQYHYNQVHGMIINGLAFHNTFEDSYRYIQDKTELLMWTLEKNKDILGDSTIQFIDGVTTTFAFEDYGEMFMYRSTTNFDVHRLILETSGRSFTG